MVSDVMRSRGQNPTKLMDMHDQPSTLMVKKQTFFNTWSICVFISGMIHMMQST